VTAPKEKVGDCCNLDNPLDLLIDRPVDQEVQTCQKHGVGANV
jgi:hypothetical protein